MRLAPNDRKRMGRGISSEQRQFSRGDIRRRPFWDDLICRSSSSIRAAALNLAGESAVAIQWERMSFWSATAPNYASPETVSFEARLFASGQIHVMMRNWPSFVPRTSLDVGVETVDGSYGTVVTTSLPFAAGVSFACAFWPWFTPPP